MVLHSFRRHQPLDSRSLQACRKGNCCQGRDSLWSARQYFDNEPIPDKQFSSFRKMKFLSSWFDYFTDYACFIIIVHIATRLPLFNKIKRIFDAAAVGLSELFYIRQSKGVGQQVEQVVRADSGIRFFFVNLTVEASFLCSNNRKMFVVGYEGLLSSSLRHCFLFRKTFVSLVGRVAAFFFSILLHALYFSFIGLQNDDCCRSLIMIVLSELQIK